MWNAPCGALSGLTALTALFGSIPATMADGTQDFRHLSTILTNATNTIWAPVNATNSTTYVPNGVGFFAIFKNTLSTADVLANITGLVLRSKFNLDTDQVGFVNHSVVPMDLEYLLYVQKISSLSSALTELGRSLHTELNLPIFSSIQALAQSINAYGADLLDRDLITGNATIRTIHAARTLYGAQTVFSRILNYPDSDHKNGYGSNADYLGRRRTPSSLTMPAGDETPAVKDVEPDSDPAHLTQPSTLPRRRRR